jgi:hypothetical protein
VGVPGNQFHDSIATKRLDSRRNRADDHPIGNGLAAGAMKPYLTFYLHHTKLTAFIAQLRPRIFYALAVAINNMRRFLSINRREIGMKAEMWYIDPGLLSCFQYRCAFGNANLDLINRYVRHSYNLLERVINRSKKRHPERLSASRQHCPGMEKTVIFLHMIVAMLLSGR